MICLLVVNVFCAYLESFFQNQRLLIEMIYTVPAIFLFNKL